MSSRSAIPGWRRCCVLLRCSCPTSLLRRGCVPAVFPANATPTRRLRRCPQRPAANQRKQNRLQHTASPPTCRAVAARRRRKPSWWAGRAAAVEFILSLSKDRTTRAGSPAPATHRATARMSSSPKRRRRKAHGPENGQDRVGDNPIGQPQRRSPTGSCRPHGQCTHPSPARGRKPAPASPARRGHHLKPNPLRSPASGAECTCP